MKTKLFLNVAMLIVALISGLQKTNAQSWRLGGNTVSQDTSLGTKNLQSVKIITNNLERIHVDANGNIGIGVTNPTEKLNVSGNILSTGVVSGNEGNFPFIIVGSGAVQNSGSDVYVYGLLPRTTSGTAPGNVILSTPNIFGFKFGNVGIGTTAPSQRLHVVGASIIANNTVINPSTLSNTVIAGAIHDGSGWAVASGIGGKAGTGQAWGIGANGGNLYFGFSNGATDNTMQTGIQITGSRNVLLAGGSGNVGVRNNNPLSTLDVLGGIWDLSTTEGDFRVGNSSFRMKIGVATAGAGAGDVRMRAVGGTNRLILGGGTNDVLAVNSSNVGIGTITPSFKLDVCGTIRAKEVLVQTGWCDYVFDKDYKLRSLNDVESYINQNKHLPDVPSATEVEDKGVKVAQMDSILIKKVEELTLYIIDQNKQIQQLQQKVIQLEKSDADKKN
jgi:hypothetical protein